jgi:hypothetical protein
MASEERTRALLEDAGFTSVRTEEVSMRWVFRNLDEYERWLTEVAGAVAMVVRELSASERDALKAQLTEAFAPFKDDGGYERPGVALCAVAN